MGVEPETANTANHSSTAWHWFAWTLIIIFIIYPLSIGPAYRLAKNTNPSSPLNTIYSPLLQLARHSRTARDLLDWYVTTVWKG